MGKSDFLEDEIKKAWKRITDLEAQVEDLMKDPERKSFQESRKTTEAKNKAWNKLEEITTIADKIEQVKSQSDSYLNSIVGSETKILESRKAWNEKYETLIASVQLLEQKTELWDALTTKYPTLEEDLSALETSRVAAVKEIAHISTLRK